MLCRRARPLSPTIEARRAFLVIGGLAGAGPGAVNLYLPALPDVASDLHASTSATQLTLALFLVGAAAGQLVFGPLSDVFGRRGP